MKPSLYFAAPLFSQAELEFNATIAAQLQKHFAVYLPQRDGGLFADLVGRENQSVETASAFIFRKDVDAINDADVLLVVLDGRVVDEGAAFEVGYAYAKGKVCVGLQTDPRRLVPFGNNPMINGPLIQIFCSVEQLLNWSESYAPIVTGAQPNTNDVGEKQ